MFTGDTEPELEVRREWRQAHNNPEQLVNNWEQCTLSIYYEKGVSLPGQGKTKSVTALLRSGI